MRTLISTFLIALLSTAPAAAEQLVATNPKPICGFGELLFDTDFPGARLNQCRKIGKNEYSLGISPENKPINHSPWYAFRVTSETSMDIVVYMYYEGTQHRYPPKISTDGQQWALLAPDSYQVILQNKAVKMRLTVGPEPIIIAAQEIIDNQHYANWFDDINKLPYIDSSILGHSVQNRPITGFTTHGEGDEWVLIIGRQHPPETTGARALFDFVETVIADTTLAGKFRQRFRLLIVPNLNPDGVAAGNWRHNMNGIDLNRDWNSFTQPETRVVADKLGDILGDSDQTLVLGLDFHSTDRDIFYIQKPGTVPHLGDFTQNWLQQIKKQVPEFEIRTKAPNKPNLGVFKNYISKKYGIPAITYEVGDHTSAPVASKVAKSAAVNMMQLLLQAEAPPPPQQEQTVAADRTQH